MTGRHADPRGRSLTPRDGLTAAHMDYSNMYKTCTQCGRHATKGYIRVNSEYVCNGRGCDK